MPLSVPMSPGVVDIALQTALGKRFLYYQTMSSCRCTCEDMPVESHRHLPSSMTGGIEMSMPQSMLYYSATDMVYVLRVDTSHDKANPSRLDATTRSTHVESPTSTLRLSTPQLQKHMISEAMSISKSSRTRNGSGRVFRSANGGCFHEIYIVNKMVTSHAETTGSFLILENLVPVSRQP
jgi:hypothetical protein